MIDAQPTSPVRMEERLRAWLPTIALVTLLIVGWFAAHAFMYKGWVGNFNDDAVYVACAKALAEGQGYILPWAPNVVRADRFPIGYPAWLSLFFLIPATYDQHIAAIQEANILLSLGFLAASYGFCVKVLGIRPVFALLGVAITLFSPFFLFIAGMAMSDLPFGLLLIGSLWLIQRYLEAPTKKALALAVAVTAAMVLVRYIGAVVPLVVFLHQLRLRRFKDATIFAGGVGLLLLPWVFWVASNRAFGYAGQIAFQFTSDMRIRLLSLFYSATLILVQGIPSFFFPNIYLANFPARSRIILGDPVYVVLGLIVTSVVAVGFGSCLKTQRWRLPFAVVAAYVALLWIWQIGFLNLGEHLTVRLLLPVAPLSLALAAAGLSDMLAGIGPAGKALVAMTSAVALLSAGSSVFAFERSVAATRLPGERKNHEYLGAMIREFDRQVPREAVLASGIEPIVYLLSGRKSWGTFPNLASLKGMLLQLPIEYFLMTENKVGDRDLTLEMFKAINLETPGLIWTVEVEGQPTGVFRVDREVWERFRAKGPTAPRS